MFCQACGADNSEDARFCNMCGAPIAAAGSPGGPVAEPTALGIGGEGSTPPPAIASDAGAREGEPTRKDPVPESTSMMNVSLEDLGVRSNSQAALLIVGVVALLMAVGGAFTYYGTRSEEPAPETGHAEASDPFVIGAPIPEGLGAPLPAPSGELPESPEAPAAEVDAPPATSDAPARPDGRPRTAPRRPDRVAGAATATATPEAPETAEPAAPESADAPVTAEASAPAAEADASDTAAAAAAREIPTDAPEERDVELEMYAGRVRFLVQRYYAARAQTCFDHATMNDPGLHGAVVIDMTIAPSGEVSRARVARNSTGDAELGQCLARQVDSWRLSPPPGGEQAQMQMPFSR